MAITRARTALAATLLLALVSSVSASVLVGVSAAANQAERNAQEQTQPLEHAGDTTVDGEPGMLTTSSIIPAPGATAILLIAGFAAATRRKG